MTRSVSVRRCAIPGCTRPYFGRGWCNTHYYRWRRHGHPEIVLTARQELGIERVIIERLPSTEAGECWEWYGYRNDRGYGRVRFEGQELYAHRVMHELVNGPIPAGMEVLHSCDNPPCCNPDHLRLGTHIENMQDAAAKGRINRTKRIRGAAWHAAHPPKTHCVRGHPLDGDNLIPSQDGRRRCRECRRTEYQRRHPAGARALGLELRLRDVS